MKKQRVTHGAEIASLCRGAFLLAETGLLNGKSCATHWITHEKFKQKYPQVNLLPEKNHQRGQRHLFQRGSILFSQPFALSDREILWQRDGYLVRQGSGDRI